MTGGSLFSGIGGLDLGAERAGVRVLWQAEQNGYRRSVLRARFPQAFQLDDVREVGADERGVDIVFGGFPCQPVSSAGKRLGQDDERWLWPEFARIVRELRPRYVVVENVPGLLARGMGSVLGDLAAVGYDAEWTCFGAGDIGAWHQRDRVFLVATPDPDQVKVWDEQGGLFRPGWADPLLPRLAGLEGAVGDADGSPADAHAAPSPSRSRPRERRDGGAPALADADEVRQQQQRGREPHGARRAGDRAPARPVADSALFGRETRRDELRRLRATSQQQLQDRAAALGGIWWATEPDVARMVHGVPDGVVRREALGDAVVPQCAELVFRRLVELDVRTAA